MFSWNVRPISLLGSAILPNKEIRALTQMSYGGRRGSCSCHRAAMLMLKSFSVGALVIGDILRLMLRRKEPHLPRTPYDKCIQSPGLMAAVPGIPAVQSYTVPPSVLYFTVVLCGGVTRNSGRSQILFKLVQGSQFGFLHIFYTKSVLRRTLSFQH